MAILSRDYRVDLPCFCAGSTDIPGGESGRNLSLLNVGSLVSPMICTVVMTIVASRNRGWLLRLSSDAFRADQHGLPPPSLCLTNISPTETTPGMLVHIGLSLFSYATLIICRAVCAAAGVDRLPVQRTKLAFSGEMPPLMSIERKCSTSLRSAEVAADSDAVQRPVLYATICSAAKKH